MRVGMKGYIGLLVLSVVLVACVPGDCPACPPCPGTPTATAVPSPTATVEPAAVLWDGRLSLYNVRYELVPNARYRLRRVWLTFNGQWGDNCAGVPDFAREFCVLNGVGGETHGFSIVYTADRSALVGKSVVLSWPGGNDVRQTDGQGKADFFTPAKYHPEQGQTGPYCMEPLKGDRLCGAGQPYGQEHTSIFGYWEEDPAWQPSLLQRVRAFITGVAE